ADQKPARSGGWHREEFMSGEDWRRVGWGRPRRQSCRHVGCVESATTHLVAISPDRAASRTRPGGMAARAGGWGLVREPSVPRAWDGMGGPPVPPAGGISRDPQLRVIDRLLAQQVAALRGQGVPRRADGALVRA